MRVASNSSSYYISALSDPSCAQVTVYATASDPDGSVRSVTLVYDPYNVGDISVSMTYTAATGFWTATTHGAPVGAVWPVYNGIKAFIVPYRIVITDNAGLSTTVQGSKPQIAETWVCTP